MALKLSMVAHPSQSRQKPGHLRYYCIECGEEVPRYEDNYCWECLEAFAIVRELEEGNE